MKAKRRYCCFLLVFILSFLLTACSRPLARKTEQPFRLNLPRQHIPRAVT